MGTFAPQSVYSNNPSPQTGAGLAALASNQEAIMELPGAQVPQSVEISDNALTFSSTPVSAYLVVDTEGQAAADDLEVINPVVSATDNLHDGMIVHLQAADAARVVTVKNTSSANGILTVGSRDIVLDTSVWHAFQLRSDVWYEVISIDEAGLVHLTGAETISGNKTFSGNNTFSGTNAFGANTTGVTATAGDNSTKYATTAYADAAATAAAPSPSSSTPAARSAAGAAGSSTAYARADHSHPNNWGSTTVAATSPAVVVETWHSGTEWYRVWSDGWIEQGGENSSGKTVTFQKAFSNTNYTVATSYYGAGTGYGRSDLNINAKTTTGIAWTLDPNTATRQWYACGY